MKKPMCVIGAALLALVAFAIWGQPTASPVTPVFTRSGSNLRHGAYTSETVLKPSNISGLHKIYSIPIRNDARGIESQPLVMPGVKGSDGVTRDLIVLSSMANDVIAADLHAGKIIWQTNLGRPIDSTKQIDFWNLAQHQGILSTGVIDPDTFTWYGVAWISPDGSPAKGWHSLHAVDLRTGAEVKKPLSMNPLTYNPGYGLEIAHFSGQMRKQRSALTLATIKGRKTVFVPAGSVLETNGSASGWVAAADVEAWRFTGSWASTTRGYGGGIWQAGQGLVVDASGFLYAITGNGSFDGLTDFSESFVKLEYTPPADTFHGMGRIDVRDWWSPYSDSGRIGNDPTASEPSDLSAKISGINAATASGRLIEPVNQDSSHHMQMAPQSDSRYAGWSDQDLGSGSIVLLEKYGVIGGAGKDGIWYSVNANNMGKTMPEDFAHPSENYAKLKAPAIWFTYAAWHHMQLPNGEWIVDPKQPFEPTMPDDVTKLDFVFGNMTRHMHSTPIVADVDQQGTIVVCHGENGNLREWRVNADGSLSFLGNGQEIASPNSPRNRGGMAGGFMALSSNGTHDALIWDLVPDGDANREITTGKLFAYDPSNLDKYPDGSGWVKTLWSSPVTADPKFNVPVVSGGYLIVPTYSATVDVYAPK